MEAPAGGTRDVCGFAIRFRDASSWSSTDDLSNASDDELGALLRFVSERSGVPITEREIIE